MGTQLSQPLIDTRMRTRNLGEPVEADSEAIGEAGREAVAELLKKMGFDVDVTVRPGDDPITIDVSGDNLGALIGRRGDSLAALQFMVNVILSKRFRQWPKVFVDVRATETAKSSH